MSITIRETNARIDALSADVAEIKALLLARVGDATPAKVTQARAPKVARVTPRAEVTLTAEPTGKVRRCKAPTTDGSRCKVRSRGDICGLHRRAVEIAVAKDAPVKGKGKKAKQAAVTKPATKGASVPKAAGGTLSRRDFNRTVTAKARFAGGKTYKRVLAEWATVQEMAQAGATPDQVIAKFAK